MDGKENSVKGEVSGEGVLVAPDEASGLNASPLRKDEDGVSLSPAEAVYMVENGRLSVTMGGRTLSFSSLYSYFQSADPGFDALYITYRDLRARGYRVETGRDVIRVFPRGGAAGETPSRYWVRTLSEGEPMHLEELLGWINACARQRRELLISISDEEGDITYYQFDEIEPKGDFGSMPKDVGGQASLTGKRVVLWDEELAGQLFEKWFIGKYVGGGGLVLSPHEAYCLTAGHGMKVCDARGDELSPQELFQRFNEGDPRFPEKHVVYEELRSRGLLPKTGYKFGCDFRVYSDHPDRQPHSPYLVHSVPEGYSFSLWSLASAVRLSHSVRKTMLYAHGLPVAFLRVRRRRL